MINEEQNVFTVKVWQDLPDGGYLLAFACQELDFRAAVRRQHSEHSRLMADNPRRTYSSTVSVAPKARERK